MGKQVNIQPQKMMKRNTTGGPGMKQRQDIQVESVPQQLMHPPAPLMSQNQMPTHPSKNEQAMQQQNDMYAESQVLEDERMRAEETILNTHLEAVKEEAQLIQREGEMITTLERAIMNEEEYDMREYLADARQIAMQKIQMYQELMSNIDAFQSTFINK